MTASLYDLDISGPDLKEVKCIKEKIPGFEKSASASERIQISAQEETITLKEKLVDPNTMQEVDKQVRNMNKALEGNALYFPLCIKIFY